METQGFQKIYTQLSAITRATVTLKAEGAANDELATVAGRLAQVVKVMGDNVTLQVRGFRRTRRWCSCTIRRR